MLNMQNNSVGYGQDQYKLYSQMSSGLRIKRASDDAAGLAISEKLIGQVRGESMATRNMSDTQSMLRTAEGALGQTHSVLHRMRKLSIQANNGILTNSDRTILQQEFTQLRDTIDAIGRDTQFNTKPLLDGTMNSFNTTTGANGQSMEMSIDGAMTSHLGNLSASDSLADVDLVNNTHSALSVIDQAIQQVSSNRSSLGSYDNRLTHSIANSSTVEINQAAAQSRIRDSDMALMSIEMSKFQTMQQAYFATQRLGMQQMGSFLNLLQ